MNEAKIGNDLPEDKFNFDLERMKKAVDSPSVTVPKGLKGKEFTKWIKDYAKGLI